jgi:hypothetical protein
MVTAARHRSPPRRPGTLGQAGRGAAARRQGRGGGRGTGQGRAQARDRLRTSAQPVIAARVRRAEACSTWIDPSRRSTTCVWAARGRRRQGHAGCGLPAGRYEDALAGLDAVLARQPEHTLTLAVRGAALQDIDPPTRPVRPRRTRGPFTSPEPNSGRARVWRTPCGWPVGKPRPAAVRVGGGTPAGGRATRTALQRRARLVPVPAGAVHRVRGLLPARAGCAGPALRCPVRPRAHPARPRPDRGGEVRPMSRR